VGQLTLLDGSSVEVAGQVQVADPGAGLDVVQQGNSAFAVDHSRGAVRRVDGATFEVGPPATPLPGARSGLRMFPGSDVVYALDADHGVLAETDPRTLARRGASVPLSARVDAQASILDDAGRLWVMDGATGDLVWLERGKRHVRPGAGTAGSALLTLAGGIPVLVDTARRTAAVLDPGTGQAGHRVALDLRPTDRVQVSGAARAARLYLATSRGVLEVCDLTGQDCSVAVQLDAEAGELGAAVETGGRVFVPDYATGRVWVVDVNGWRVLAQPKVVDPNTRFQLLNRDGVVFFNDPDSERAGVIRLDGGVRSVNKYNPADPGKGIDGAPAARGKQPGSLPSKPSTGHQTPPPGRTPAPKHSTPNTPPGPVPHGPTSPATGPQVPPGPGPGPSVSPAPSSSAPGPPQVRIVMSGNDVPVGQTVTFRVSSVSPPAPVTAHWQFGAGNPPTADGLTVSSSWSTAGTWPLNVVATFPGGGTSVASATVSVHDVAPSPTPSPSPKTSQFVLGVGGPGKVTISGPGLTNGQDCPPDCTATFPGGSVVKLNGGQLNTSVATWAFACPDFQQVCNIVMPSDGSTVRDFATTVQNPLLTITVNTDQLTTGSSVDTGFGSCPPTCSLRRIPPGSAYLLRAKGQGGDPLVVWSWHGDCFASKQSATCRITMDGDRFVSIDFASSDACPPRGCCPPGKPICNPSPNAIHHTQQPASLPVPEPRKAILARRRRFRPGR
jgi:hypothetical protein